MQVNHLVILLPCHSLDDFPVYHRGDDADNLLANWSALWHPALVHAASGIAGWQRADSPPADCAEHLFVIPTISKSELPTGFTRRVEDEGGVLVQVDGSRDDISSAAIAQLSTDTDTAFDAEIVRDFHALGFCYLQTQLLTRHMRYSSNLDEKFFAKQVVAAATAASQGDASQCREKLQSCFDVLAEERDHFYPVDAFLLDLTLVADSTTGKPLIDELEGSTVSNLLISGEVVESIATHDPDSLEAIKRALSDDRAELVGGEYRELRLPLLTNESIRAELDKGVRTYESILGSRPYVFGRRRFGLTPGLPSLLLGAGFTAAVHSTLDDGQFPEGMQMRVLWEGATDHVIDAFAKIPLDASKPESFLNLAIKLGEQMDMDHVATLCFAHWPGQHSTWYDDLRRAAKFSNALGSFLGFGKFFQESEEPAHHDRFKADQYKSPYLVQAVAAEQPDPISRLVRYWREMAALKACQAIGFLADTITGDTSGATSIDDKIQELDESAEAPSSSKQSRFEAELSTQMARLAEALPRDADPSEGALLVNPCSFVRRLGVNCDSLNGAPQIERPVYAADSQNGMVRAVVDVPAMGFAWIQPSTGRPSGKGRRRSISLAEEFVLRNEYCELIIDTASGGIRSIHEYNARKNRMSQQLAYRLSKSEQTEGGSEYSHMVADRLEVTVADDVCGQIVSTGRLIDGAQETLAEFKQTTTIWRGSRVIEVDVELDPKRLPSGDPWNSYYCNRTAWRDEAADLFMGVGQHRHPVSVSRFESPEYIEIEFDDKRTTLLTGGLTFHRKAKLNTIDSLMIVRGETERRFQFGIGLDVTHPGQAAESFVAPRTMVTQTAGAPSPAPSSWLFHVDAKNVSISNWQVMEFAQPPADSAESANEIPKPQEIRSSVAEHERESGAVEVEIATETDGAEATTSPQSPVGHGIRIRMIETMGRSVTANLQGFRPFKHAAIVDFEGRPIRECKIDDGAVAIPIQAHQFIQVDIGW